MKCWVVSMFIGTTHDTYILHSLLKIQCLMMSQCLMSLSAPA